MGFRFFTFFILSTLFFVYFLISPFLANLEHQNMRVKNLECDSGLVTACFLGMRLACYDYTNTCVVPEGWLVKSN